MFIEEFGYDGHPSCNMTNHPFIGRWTQSFIRTKEYQRLLTSIKQLDPRQHAVVLICGHDGFGLNLEALLTSWEMLCLLYGHLSVSSSLSTMEKFAIALAQDLATELLRSR